MLIAVSELLRRLQEARQQGFEEGSKRALAIESERSDPRQRVYERTGSYPSVYRSRYAAALREIADLLETGQVDGVICAAGQGAHAGGVWWIDGHEPAQAILDATQEYAAAFADSALWQRNGQRVLRRPLTKQ